MWSTIVTATAFIIILSILVILHELGHYLAALWAKVKVHEFGLGYPPRALTLFTYRGTKFSLNWIPFGGFVQMEGEDYGLDKVHDQKKKEQSKIGPFYEKSAWKRLVVLLAGVTVNFLFGILIFSIIFTLVGIPTPLTSARIGYVAPDSPAAAAQLPTNVEIIGLKTETDQVSIATMEQAIDSISQYRGQTVTLVTTGSCQSLQCQESAQEFSVYIRTAEETPSGEGSVGIAFDPYVLQFYPWYQMPFRGMWYGVQEALFMGILIIRSLGSVISQAFTQGTISAELAGPVGIVHQVQQAGILEQGWLAVANFMAMLSINLGVMNLLPIPALDGGRALFILLEKLVGRVRLSKVEGYIHYGGFIFLITLIVLITVRDIVNIFV